MIVAWPVYFLIAWYFVVRKPFAALMAFSSGLFDLGVELGSYLLSLDKEPLPKSHRPKAAKSKEKHVSNFAATVSNEKYPPMVESHA